MSLGVVPGARLHKHHLDYATGASYELEDGNISPPFAPHQPSDTEIMHAICDFPSLFIDIL